MNKLVQLSIVLALLASGACKANDGGLCKPVCAEEKRVCRVQAAKMSDRDSKWSPGWNEKNASSREFGEGRVQTKQPIGPEVRNTQDRMMTRNRLCDDAYMTCARACTTRAPEPVSSSVLVKPARTPQVGVSTSSQSELPN